MSYVDGYVLPVPKDKVEEYRKIAQKAGDVWKEHGALAYKECVLDDDSAGTHGMRSFAQIAAISENETVVFAYVVFNSREDRDRINAAVMNDPRLKDGMENMPFDHKRMAWAGFKSLVDM